MSFSDERTSSPEEMVPRLPDDVLALFPSLDTLSDLTITPVFDGSYEMSFVMPKGKLGQAVEYDLGVLGQDIRTVIRSTRETYALSLILTLL